MATSVAKAERDTGSLETVTNRDCTGQGPPKSINGTLLPT